MTTYLRGKWWWYSRMIEGRRYYRPLGIRKGQEHLLSARVAQEDAEIASVHYGLPSPARGRNVLLSEFLEVYEQRKRGKGTLAQDMGRFRIALPILGDRRLMDYRLKHFQELEDALLAKRGQATVNRYMQILHHLFEVARREKVIAENPLDGYEYFVEDAGKRRALTDAEIQTLFASLRRIRDYALLSPRALPVQAMLYDVARFGLYTGARLNEIVGMRRDEIDGDILRLRVGRTKFRKRGRPAPVKVKNIYMPPEAVAIIAAQPADGEYVFPMRRRDPRVISKAVYDLSEQGRLGVEDFTFHCLRHTWISRATEITDGPTVRDMAGHTDYRTTLVYTHSDDAKKRGVVTKLATSFRSLDVSA